MRNCQLPVDWFSVRFITQNLCLTHPLGFIYQSFPQRRPSSSPGLRAANPRTALCAHLSFPSLCSDSATLTSSTPSSIRDSFLVCAFTAPTQLTKPSAVLVLTSGTSIPEEIKGGQGFLIFFLSCPSSLHGGKTLRPCSGLTFPGIRPPMSQIFLQSHCLSFSSPGLLPLHLSEPHRGRLQSSALVFSSLSVLISVTI